MLKTMAASVELVGDVNCVIVGAPGGTTLTTQEIVFVPGRKVPFLRPFTTKVWEPSERAGVV